jgi:hypothetical protein
MTTPQDPAKGRLDPFVVSAAALLLYLAFPSRLHLFDGVACAVAVELADLRHLVHGNHLAYGLAGLAFHKALWALGARLPALWSLQVLDSCLGALGAGCLASLLRAQGFSRRTSALCAASMAASYGYWLWSLEANVYLLGTLFLILAAGESLRDRPRPLALALWHALAMLSHSANALFAPAALLGLRRSGPRATAAYLASAAILVLAAYLAAALLCVRPEGLGDLKLWLLGSAALGPGRSWRWQGCGTLAGNLADWAASSGRLLCPSLPWLGLPVWAAAAFPFPGRLKAAGWLWLLAYFPLFLFWQPFNLIYRVTDSAALFLLAAPCVERLHSLRGWRWLPAAASGALLSANLAFSMLPLSRALNNAALQEALWIGRCVPERGWVAAETDGEVYIPYFAHRRTVNLRYYLGRPRALRERVEGLLASGESVFLTDRVLAGACGEAFSGLRLAEKSRLGRSVLFRLEGKSEGKKEEKIEKRRGAQKRAEGDGVLPAEPAAEQQAGAVDRSEQ